MTNPMCANPWKQIIQQDRAAPATLERRHLKAFERVDLESNLFRSRKTVHQYTSPTEWLLRQLTHPLALVETKRKRDGGIPGGVLCKLNVNVRSRTEGAIKRQTNKCLQG